MSAGGAGAAAAAAAAAAAVVPHGVVGWSAKIDSLGLLNSRL